MARIAQTHKDKLKLMLEDIGEWYEYFRENSNRFNNFYRMIFESTLSENDITVLKELQKPQIEFNILESYISRLRGEFSKYEPSISVHSNHPGLQSGQMVKLLEGNFRSILHDANNDNFEYNIYTDLLAGGYSVGKIYTEYKDAMSFDQNICVGRVFDPTLCCFDPRARKSHKADGKFATELYPMTRDDFEDQFGTAASNSMMFTRNLGAFNWSYASAKGQEYVLVANHYIYKMKKKKIVQLVTGQTMTVDDYEQFVEMWMKHNLTPQPPIVVGKARDTELPEVERYWICETEVLEHKHTNFKYFPIFFIDGNSVMVRENQQGLSKQVTRPYVYNAAGIQKLKNFAGQTLANELENMIMHKWKVPLEGIPEGFEDAYKNPQKPSTIVYNAFRKDSPEVAIPPPEAIVRAPMPPEISQAFTLSDEVTRAILGSFDMDLSKITENQISGIAIQESMSLSNNAAMPYIVGYLKGLSHLANIYLDLMPKYMITPRSIPVLKSDGKRSYEPINHNSQSMLSDYANFLEVRIEAGVNFQLQKNQAFAQIAMLMKISPQFAQFINQEGLDVLLDNIEIRGIEQIQERAADFMKQQKALLQKQQSMQQSMPNPKMAEIQLKSQELQEKKKQNEIDNHIEVSKIAIEEQNADTNRMLAEAKMGQVQSSAEVGRAKAAAETTRSMVDMAVHLTNATHKDRDHVLEIQKMAHTHTKEAIELAHTIEQAHSATEDTEA